METDRRYDISFTSAEGHTTIHGYIWPATAEPKGIVQLVHGMAEHILRYEPFCAALGEAGFITCGHDALGHGRSVRDRRDLGHLPAKGGSTILIEDVDRMRREALREIGANNLPYFLFGHSMGSFVVRNYLRQHADGLAGAIICGTGQLSGALTSSGLALARTIARTRGERYVSKLLVDLSVGSYAKAIEGAKTDLDWLSYDRANIDAYIADELCGFPFTAGGNVTLMELTRSACSQKGLSQVPDDLPLLYIAGDSDPVGEAGKGVLKRVDEVRRANKRDVSVKIYERRRHEILNDEGKEEVMHDIIEWMEERI